jgi:hypothetical protein
LFAFHNLDVRTRQLMLEEITLDVSLGSLYLSKRFSPAGQRD